MLSFQLGRWMETGWILMYTVWCIVHRPNVIVAETSPNVVIKNGEHSWTLRAESPCVVSDSRDVWHKVIQLRRLDHLYGVHIVPHDPSLVVIVCRYLNYCYKIPQDDADEFSRKFNSLTRVKNVEKLSWKKVGF